MFPQLNSVLSEITKIVNYVKGNPLNSRLFAALCNDANSEHTQVTLHADIRWFSWDKVLFRVFELQNELAQFLHVKKTHWLTQPQNSE